MGSNQQSLIEPNFCPPPTIHPTHLRYSLEKSEGCGVPEVRKRHIPIYLGVRLQTGGPEGRVSESPAQIRKTVGGGSRFPRG